VADFAWHGDCCHGGAAHCGNQSRHDQNGDEHSASPSPRGVVRSGGCADPGAGLAHPRDFTRGEEATNVAQRGPGDVQTIGAVVRDCQQYSRNFSARSCEAEGISNRRPTSSAEWHVNPIRKTLAFSVSAGGCANVNFRSKESQHTGTRRRFLEAAASRLSFRVRCGRRANLGCFALQRLRPERLDSRE
jgi:hypothetical protein